MHLLGTKSSRFLFPSQNPPSSWTLTPLQHKQKTRKLCPNKSHCFQSTRQNNVMWMWTSSPSSLSITSSPSSISITSSFIHHFQWSKFFPNLKWKFDTNLRYLLTHLLTYLPTLPIFLSPLTNLLVWTLSHNMQLFLMQVKDQPGPPTHQLPPSPPKTQSEVPYVFFIGEISPKTEFQNFKN